MTRWRWSRLGGVWRPLVLLPIVALFLGPLALMASTSLRETGRPLSRQLEWLPRPLAWENYPAVFELLDLWRFAANSAFVVALAVPLTIVVASWAGYAMALLSSRAQRRLLVFGVLLLMVPVTALWLTRYILFAWLGSLIRSGRSSRRP